MEQDLFERYLNEKNRKYIKIALTDSSYNTARVQFKDIIFLKGSLE